MAEFYPVLAAFGLLVYAVVKLRLNRVAQPLRMQLIERANVLLDDPKITDARRRWIQFELDGAFGRTWLMLFAFVGIPFFAVWCLFSSHDRARMLDDATRGRVDAFDELSNRLDLLNHPILMPLVYAWLAAWLLPTMILAGLAGKAVQLMTPPEIFAAFYTKR